MATNVNGITGTSNTDGQQTPASGSSKLGKDEFLKIFLAQLGQQDPTSPVDSQAFVAQLAEFAALELQQNANSHLESLMIGQAAEQQTSVTNLVGKDVIYKTDTVSISNGGSAAVTAHISADAGNVTAKVTDSTGKTVRTIQLGPHTAGDLAVTWDGRDDNGNALPAGSYKMAVTASDKTGASVPVEQRAQAHVTGVSFENGVSELLLGTQHVKLSEIVEIKERTTP